MSDNKTITTETEKDEIINTLKFIDVNDRIASVDDRFSIIIVAWDWGRESKNCHKCGFCNVEWFPDFKSYNSSNMEMASILEHDEDTNSYYVDALLSEPLPEDIDPADLTGTIDFDLPLVNAEGEDVIQGGLIFEHGIFEFDETLGDFGGYRIFLK